MNESTLVPREEMSDLDWLARNVHVWVEDWTHVRKCQVRHEAKWMASLSPNAEYKDWRTKAQWLARRAELQNKPSWKDVPDWVMWISQDGSGNWWIYETEPKSILDCRGGSHWSCNDGSCESLLNYSGEVLGDHLDTLEKRPEQKAFEPFVSVKDAKQELENLDWLAASIAEWPQIKDWNVKMDRGVSFFDDGVHIYNSDGSDYETISKRDWEIKVMELNKKPSIQTAKALDEAKLIEGQKPAGVYGVDYFYKPVCTGVAEDAATAKQPSPKGSGNPILGMVLADLTNRALEGKEKYGEPLLAHNGRNPLWDAYQEALDLAMYLRQAIEEQKQ